MEIILIVVLIVLVIILDNQNKQRIQRIEYYFNELKKELAKNRDSYSTPTPKKEEPPVVQPVQPIHVPPVTKEEIAPEPVPAYLAEEVIAAEVEEVSAPEAEEVISAEPVAAPVAQTFFERNQPPKITPKQTFFERNPDLEKFIGENLINKIGIAILVLGIGFFVKYAIDQNWINEYGRAGIGILCGGILLGFAHYTRLKFKAFSSVLVGGGIAVLYFTIGIAFHQYHLFSQTVAFAIMVVITGFSILLALSYDRLELAVLSIIGGFSTPFMVSTGEGNYVVLFTYLMILNVGMLTLAYFKKWNIINILSYAFTILIYGGWLFTKMESAEFPPYGGALLFASLFYLVFFSMHMINNIKVGRTFEMLDFSLLLSNTFLYYGAGMFILNHIESGYYEGMFTASLAVFNFAFAFVLYKNQKVDKNLVFLLIGLVLSFVSLTAPIQLEGNRITLFWAAETVLLLWLSQKSGIRLMKIASCIILGLMTFSLLLDWRQVYFGISYAENGDIAPPMALLINKGFTTGVVSVLALLFSVLLLKKENEKDTFISIEIGVYKILLGIGMVVLLYFTLFLELNYQLFARFGYEPANQIIIGFFNTVFVIALYLFTAKRESSILRGVLLLMGGLLLLLYMLYYNGQAILIRNDYLTGGYAVIGNYLFHYLMTAATLALLFLFFKNTKKIYGINSEMGIALLWFTSFVIIYMASAELSHLSVMVNYSANTTIPHVIEQTYKIGFPILWGICSFALMVIGMRLKMKHLRIISLSLFLITLLKLFIFDIKGISEGGKIAAFISLGVILLIISFMYQKLKVLILEDGAEKQKKETGS